MVAHRVKPSVLHVGVTSEMVAGVLEPCGSPVIFGVSRTSPGVSAAKLTCPMRSCAPWSG
eukprot:10900375-Karenia_brevis.AAC.1